MSRNVKLLSAVFLGLCLVWTSGGRADGTAQDAIVLKIEGKIQSPTAVEMSIHDIEKIGSMAITTSTPWHTGRVTFEGVRMRDLLRAVGATGRSLTVLALNKYMTQIPIEDFEQNDVILAYKRDGNYMPVRDKGPLFIIYPYDSNPLLNNDKYYTRSAWQVATMIVE